MIFTFNDSAILENSKGGKESKVKVSISLKKGVHSINIWMWSAEICVQRNRHTFQKELKTSLDDKLHLLRDLSAGMCKEIRMTYSEGCNVESQKIIDFVGSSVEKFITELPKKE